MYSGWVGEKEVSLFQNLKLRVKAASIPWRSLVGVALEIV